MKGSYKMPKSYTKMGYGRSKGYGTKGYAKFAPGQRNGDKKRYSDEAMKSAYEKYSQSDKSKKSKNSKTSSRKRYGY